MRAQHRQRNLDLALVGTLAVAVIGASSAVSAPSAPGYRGAQHTVLPLISPHSYHAKPLRIITIVGNDQKPNDPTTFDNRVLWFGNALVTSEWYTAASKAYHLGAHGTAGQIRLTHLPVIKPGVTTDTIEASLRHWMAAAKVKRDPKVRSIYVMYLSCVPGTNIGIATCGQSSFHPQLTIEANDPNFVEGDSMVMVLMPEVHGKQVNIDLTDATTYASHEIIEATTDSPAPGQMAYVIHSNEPDTPFDVSPWVYNEGSAIGQTEVADVAQGTRIGLHYSHPGHSFTYAYQRFYTPASARHNGNPFVPNSPEPYNSVSTIGGWVTDSIAGGGEVQIPVRGWSTRAVKSWKISAFADQWSGHPDDPTTPDPCSFSLDRKTINNNVVGVLTVKAAHPGTVTVNDWCAITIKSATTTPVHLNDFYHQWVTGVRFVS